MVLWSKRLYELPNVFDLVDKAMEELHDLDSQRTDLGRRSLSQ